MLSRQAFDLTKFVTLHSTAFADIQPQTQRETRIRGLMWR
jgi:hypothetical protein